MYPNLFSPIKIGRSTLKNRIIMAPLYLGYAGKGGAVSPLLLSHYRLMAQSGAAMIVVENATIDHPVGSGSDRTIRADTDESTKDLSRLADTIKKEGALACLQINHAGRFAGISEPVAPTSMDTFGKTPHALTPGEIDRIADRFAQAALRVKNAGYDMVELHGGTGYLLAQFLSPRTNKRDDEFGGALESRQRFPLMVLSRVKSLVGSFPVGYRFLADEWMPDGLETRESVPFAKALDEAGVAYISVMGGTYESFFLPEIVAKSKAEAYMAELAATVKADVKAPVVAAGRISNPGIAEKLISGGKADIIGLARVLWADPKWPEKVKSGRERDIVHCDEDCDLCMQLVMKGKPAYCSRWSAEKVRAHKELFQ